MSSRLIVSLTLFAVLWTCSLGQKVQTRDTIDRGGKCREFAGRFSDPFHIRTDVKLWQCVILLLCFGAFTVFVVLIHRLVRTWVFYDAHLLDTFFDGGGDINLGLVACGVVARWTFTSTFTISTADVIRNGVVGCFWYAAGTVVPICLFAIVSAEIRIKAPGAKTFLQVIKVRHGQGAHVALMVFAMLINILVVGMVMMEGTRILAAVTDNLNKEIIILLLCVVTCVYTAVGGVGGSLYVAYFGCLIMFAIVIHIYRHMFFNSSNSETNLYGNMSAIWDRMECVVMDPSSGNEADSPWTFVSKKGLEEGLVLAFSSFGIVFVDQSFWQTGVASKPQHGVWGYLTGAIAYFGLPLAISYALGLAYWCVMVDYQPNVYNHVIPDAGFLNGTVFIVAAQKLMGTTGSFLVFVLTMVAVVTTASGQVLSASSIVVYDMYQTYISPFKEVVGNQRSVDPRAAKAIRNEEYLEYDRRCVILKHVVVVIAAMLPLAIALILLSIKIDHWWLFNFAGLLSNSCVLPISMAITWHRIQGRGIYAGVLSGLAGGIIVWLIFSGVQHGGMKQFREATGGTGAIVISGPFIAGLAFALFSSGVVCVAVSLACGGCNSELQEEDVWEKTRQIDNPILPWSVKYAPEVGNTDLSQGRPQLYTMRRTFKKSEICAYILGVLLAVVFLLVWPALMLFKKLFSKKDYEQWTNVVFAWLIIAFLYLLIVPLAWELFRTIRQVYYNRMWVRTEDKTHLDLDTGGQDPATNFSHTEDRADSDRNSDRADSDLGAHDGPYNNNNNDDDNRPPNGQFRTTVDVEDEPNF